MTGLWYGEGAVLVAEFGFRSLAALLAEVNDFSARSRAMLRGCDVLGFRVLYQLETGKLGVRGSSAKRTFTTASKGS